MASSYDPGTGILTLSGVASLADYQTALEAIRFSAAGENPVEGSRIVEVVVNDGANNSQAATALLTVVAVNDAPALVVADANYQENAAPVLLSPSASLTDADDTELNFAAVQITAGSFPGDGDILTIGGATSGTVTGITFLWNPHCMRWNSQVRVRLQTIRRCCRPSHSNRPATIPPTSTRVATDTDLVRIGWRGRYDRNDDARYRCRERPAPGGDCRNRCVYRERTAGDDLAGSRGKRRRQLRPGLWRGQNCWRLG